MSALLEVLRAFLKLGVSSFGGPVAHIGYFRHEFVVRRRWLDDAAFSDLLALCQFLPGPASSQLGFSIGLLRAGYAGALAAWSAFTLPSALALVAFARGVELIRGPLGDGALHGLKLAAVAIVAQALIGMARTLCPDLRRAAIAALAALIVLLSGTSRAQIAAILWGGAAGFWLCRIAASPPGSVLAIAVSHRAGTASLALFGALLVGALLAPRIAMPPSAQLCAAFYRAGALVFGGGHVVLPLLHDAFVLPGWVEEGTFLAGYGAAQAVPGPLFSFAAFLGSVVTVGPRGAAGAALGLIALFLPGMLILLAALPFWQTLRTRTSAQAAIRGVNAAVVGLLGAALYRPVAMSAISTRWDVAVALAGFLLLTRWRTPPIVVVLACALAGIGLAVSVP